MFGDRLKLARKKAGYSLRGLSEAIDGAVTAQALSKYERGQMLPGSALLIQLARALEVTIEYLLSEQVEELENMEFRKASGTSAKDRALVSAQVIDQMQRYLNIEDILDLDRSSNFVSQSNSRLLHNESEAEALAEELRKEWNLGIDPIPNMSSLLEDRGIKVVMIDLPEKVSGLTCRAVRQSNRKDVTVIVVNQRMTLERRRLTLAHELGHQLIHEDSEIKHEKAANIFAQAFLVPRAHLVEETGQGRKAIPYPEFVQLKHMYRVSAVALLMRLRQTNVISQSQLEHAFRTYASPWRSREPDPLEQPGNESQQELPQRFERLCYRALAEDLISIRKAIELLQQPEEEIMEVLKWPS